MFRNTVFELRKSAEFRIILLEMQLVYEHCFALTQVGFLLFHPLLAYVPLLSTETGF